MEDALSAKRLELLRLMELSIVNLNGKKFPRQVMKEIN